MFCVNTSTHCISKFSLIELKIIKMDWDKILHFSLKTMLYTFSRLINYNEFVVKLAKKCNSIRY